MKRLATLALAAAFVLAVATPAFANHGIGTGTAECGINAIVYTFTIASSGATVGHVTTRLGDGDTPFTVTETLRTPPPHPQDSLVWRVSFLENSGKTIHDHGTITVNFDGTCSTPTSSTPTPPPTTTPPTPPPTHSTSTPPPPTHHTTPPPPCGGTACTGANTTAPLVWVLFLSGIGLSLMYLARRRSA